MTIGAGADGYYTVVFVCTLDIPGNGQLELRFRKNGAGTPFRTGAIDVAADEKRQFVVFGGGNLVAGDVVDVTIQGSGNATATVEGATFQIER